MSCKNFLRKRHLSFTLKKTLVGAKRGPLERQLVLTSTLVSYAKSSQMFLYLISFGTGTNTHKPNLSSFKTVQLFLLVRGEGDDGS